MLKIPALLAAARKLADVDENSGSLSFKGTLYPKEKVIIYNLAEGEAPKSRKRKKAAPQQEPEHEGALDADGAPAEGAEDAPKDAVPEGAEVSQA